MGENRLVSPYTEARRERESLSEIKSYCSFLCSEISLLYSLAGIYMHESVIRRRIKREGEVEKAYKIQRDACRMLEVVFAVYDGHRILYNV